MSTHFLSATPTVTARVMQFTQPCSSTPSGGSTDGTDDGDSSPAQGNLCLTAVAVLLPALSDRPVAERLAAEATAFSAAHVDTSGAALRAFVAGTLRHPALREHPALAASRELFAAIGVAASDDRLALEDHVLWYVAALASATAVEQILPLVIVQGTAEAVTSPSPETGFGLANELYGQLLRQEQAKSAVPGAAGDTVQHRRFGTALLVSDVVGNPLGVHLRNLLWHGFLAPQTAAVPLCVLQCGVLETILDVFGADCLSRVSIPVGSASAAAIPPCWAPLAVSWRAKLEAIVPPVPNLGACSGDSRWAPILKLAASLEPSSNPDVVRLGTFATFPAMEAALRELASAHCTSGWLRDAQPPLRERLTLAHDGQQYFTLAQLLLPEIPHPGTLLTAPPTVAEDAAALGDESLWASSGAAWDTCGLAIIAPWVALVGRLPPLGPNVRNKLAHGTVALSQLSEPMTRVVGVLARDLVLRAAASGGDRFDTRGLLPPAECGVAILIAHAVHSVALTCGPCDASMDGSSICVGVMKTGLCTAPARRPGHPGEPVGLSDVTALRSAIRSSSSAPVAARFPTRPAGIVEESPPWAGSGPDLWPCPTVVTLARACHAALMGIQRAIEAFDDEVQVLQRLVEARQARTAHRKKLGILVDGRPTVAAVATHVALATRQLFISAVTNIVAGGDACPKLPREFTVLAQRVANAPATGLVTALLLDTPESLFLHQLPAV